MMWSSSPVPSWQHRVNVGRKWHDLSNR